MRRVYFLAPTMLSAFADLHPVVQALIATLFTWGLTALGASLILFVNTMNRKVLDAMLAFTGGVMIAASFWSLLEPAIGMSAGGALPRRGPPPVGFLS